MGRAPVHGMGCTTSTSSCTTGEFLLGMGMVRGLVSLAGTDRNDEVVDAVRSSLTTARYKPGVGLRLGAAAWPSPGEFSSISPA